MCMGVCSQVSLRQSKATWSGQPEKTLGTAGSLPHVHLRAGRDERLQCVYLGAKMRLPAIYFFRPVTLSCLFDDTGDDDHDGDDIHDDAATALLRNGLTSAKLCAGRNSARLENA